MPELGWKLDEYYVHLANVHNSQIVQDHILVWGAIVELICVVLKINSCLVHIFQYIRQDTSFHTEELKNEVSSIILSTL